MAKVGIAQITTAQTFQTWLDRTNEIVDIIASDAMTASALGDTTVGNATLVGSFTANTVITNDLLRADTISPKSGSTSVSIIAPVTITSAAQTTQTLSSISGPRALYSSGSLIWSVGFENTSSNRFIINTGSGPIKLSLSPTGDLTIGGSLFLSGGTINANVIGNVTGDLEGNVTGNVSGNAGTVTDGVYTLGDQTIAGAKTFTSIITGSITGNAGTVTNGVYTLGSQTIEGQKTFSLLRTSDTILPTSNLNHDIGSTTLRYRSMHASTFRGNATSANYADLAEKYLADKNYEFGTVISVGGEFEVTATSIETSHSIIGVVSDKPAFLMNENLENGTIVALKGRVPVKVTGVVNKGDRLTASDVPGYAVANNSMDVRSFAISLSSDNNGMVEAIIL